MGICQKSPVTACQWEAMTLAGYKCFLLVTPSDSRLSLRSEDCRQLKDGNQEMKRYIQDHKSKFENADLKRIEKRGSMGCWFEGR